MNMVSFPEFPIASHGVDAYRTGRCVAPRWDPRRDAAPSNLRCVAARRARRRRGLGRTAIVGVAGGLTLLSSIIFAAWLYFGSQFDPAEQLELGLRLARKGEFGTAAKLAKTTKESNLTKRVQSSTRAFLIGADARQSALQMQYHPARTEKNEAAVASLEKSRDLRFPPGYDGMGNYLLGMALYELFRWGDAVAPLAIASERWPQGRSDTVECLIDIDLYGDHADPAAAMQKLDRWSALIALTPADTDRIAVKRMEILLRQQELTGIDPIWKTIAVDSPMRPNANLIFARCLRQQARDASSDAKAQLLTQALERLKEIDDLKSVSVSTRRRSMLEEGLVQRDSGQLSQAVSTFSSLRLASPFEPEFMMAGIEEIDVLIDLDMFYESAATLEQLKKNFVEPKWYDNCWMPIKVMRQRLLQAAQRILAQEEFAASDKFVSALPSMCDEVDRLRLDVAIHDTWARALQKKFSTHRSSTMTTGDSERPVASNESERIEKTFRRAGQSIERLSRLDMRSPEFMDLLWRGIEDFHFSNDFEDSNRLINRYLDLAPRADHAAALLMRAKNEAALGQPRMALNTIDKLILAVPNSPLLPDAKLVAARLLWGLEDYDRAEALISDNLYAGNLKPDSPIWKESLLELGTLMFRQGEQLQFDALSASSESSARAQEVLPDLERSYQQFLQSVASMEEGLRRFTEDPRRFQLLYMTAKAYRMASVWPDKLLRENRLVSEESITQWRTQRKELLIRSRDTFAELRRAITADSEAVKTSQMEILLCNSYFGEADILFQEGNYSAAMEAYRAVANRFINEPESLEAFVQIALCQEELGQREEMRRTLEMAIDVLRRIPTDRDERFKKNTRQDRAGWEKQIQWMIDQIKSPNIQ